MLRRTAAALLFLGLAFPASTTASPTVDVALDPVQVNVPLRGDATVNVTITVRDRCAQADDGFGAPCPVGSTVFSSGPGDRVCGGPGPSLGYAGPYFLADGTERVQLKIAPYQQGLNKFCVVVSGFTTPPTVASVLFDAPDVYPSSDNKNCSDFPSQRAAQEEFNRWRPRDPYGLDGGKGNGVACESNRAPYYRGSEYPAPPLVVPLAVPPPPAIVVPDDEVTPSPNPPLCAKPSRVQSLIFSRTKYPNIYRHFRLALKQGWPRVMVLNRAGADKRRARLLRNKTTRKGMDRDEYPAAVGRGVGVGLQRGTAPTGWRASVRLVPSKENRSHGASLGSKLRRFCDGTRFRYVFR